MTPRRVSTGVILAALLVVGLPATARAQRITMTLNSTSVAFPSADPDTVPVLTSTPLTIDIRIQQNNSGPWNVTLQAGGDLVSGGSTIDISAVTWTMAPAPPFANGTLSKSIAQTLASGTGNVLSKLTGTITFKLANSWTYDVGTYTQSLIFTVSTP